MSDRGWWQASEPQFLDITTYDFADDKWPKSFRLVKAEYGPHGERRNKMETARRYILVEGPRP